MEAKGYKHGLEGKAAHAWFPTAEEKDAVNEGHGEGTKERERIEAEKKARED